MKEIFKNIDPDGWLPYMAPLFIICCVLIGWMAWSLV
jgi:hypothetical protein